MFAGLPLFDFDIHGILVFGSADDPNNLLQRIFDALSFLLQGCFSNGRLCKKGWFIPQLTRLSQRSPLATLHRKFLYKRQE